MVFFKVLKGSLAFVQHSLDVLYRALGLQVTRTRYAPWSLVWEEFQSWEWTRPRARWA